MSLTVFAVFLEWEEGRISLSAPDLFEQTDPGGGGGWDYYDFLGVFILPALVSEITQLFTSEYNIPCVILYLPSNIKN